MKIRLATAELQRDSIVDGTGIRSVIWTQGCPHHCAGCHNPQTHSYDAGILVDVEDIKQEIRKLEGQDGITFSGGDPIEQVDACLEIAKYCKDIGLNIWCYTGYTFEELLERTKVFPNIRKFLELVDVLVDGKFMMAEKSYDVLFRGSKNQRLIDVPESLKSNKTVLVAQDDTLSSVKGRKNHYMYV